jgi:hypothetical protein
MSRYFVLPEEGVGPGGDIIFRSLRTPGVYALYAGEAMFGTVHKIGSKWAGVSWKEHSEFFGNVRKIDGFATRLDAATFVIKHHGYWMQDERESRAIAEQMRP